MISRLPPPAVVHWQHLLSGELFSSLVALAIGVLGLWLLVPRNTRMTRVAGSVLSLGGFSLLIGSLPMFSSIGPQVVFWILAGVTVISAGAAISMQSAVYAAIWFALSLLGTGGLFLFQGAQFLGVATVVVYAGAIIVTLLFVIMLAQPEGSSSYDRVGWGWYPKLVSTVAAATLVAVLNVVLSAYQPATVPPSVADLEAGVLTEAHVAGFGVELMGRHLISVEVAGTLLLVALVGAVAIAIQGKDEEIDQAEGGGR